VSGVPNRDVFDHMYFINCIRDVLGLDPLMERKKLSSKAIEHIRTSTMKPAELARRYNVAASHISNIRAGRSYRVEVDNAAE
jgi:hypothetical protein